MMSMIVVQVQWNLFVDTSSRVKSHKMIFDSKTDNIGQTNQTNILLAHPVTL